MNCSNARSKCFSSKRIWGPSLRSSSLNYTDGSAKGAGLKGLLELQCKPDDLPVVAAQLSYKVHDGGHFNSLVVGSRA